MAKVLIVDDDPLMSRMYSRTLTWEGFEVEIAENGQAGLKMLEIFQPNIILLDIMMPKMNGLEMLTHLKANPKTKEIPVVVLTNLTDSYTTAEAKRHGAVRYIIKTKHTPVDVATMLKETLDQTAK